MVYVSRVAIQYIKLLRDKPLSMTKLGLQQSFQLNKSNNNRQTKITMTLRHRMQMQAEAKQNKLKSNKINIDASTYAASGSITACAAHINEHHGESDVTAGSHEGNPFCNTGYSSVIHSRGKYVSVIGVMGKN